MRQVDPRIFRVIDANLNRLNEALRVIEDVMRFVVSDPHLTGRCKAMRHRVAEWSHKMAPSITTLMRSADNDVGLTHELTSEYVRHDIWDVVFANMKRAEQAMRALEEFAKLVDSQLAAEMEQLRYEAYQFELPLVALHRPANRLQESVIYVLTDTCGDHSRFQAKIEALVAAKVDLIQLRNKSMSDDQLLTYAETLTRLTRPAGILSIINDRVDLAMAANASGVHLGQEDLPIQVARQIAGVNLLIGVSTHNITQARQAVIDGADYIGIGPTFASQTKDFQQYAGVEYIRQIAGEITLPGFAIGGINSENVPKVVEAGLRRVAISAAIPENLAEVFPYVDQLRHILLKARPAASG